ncbi:putative ABC transporter permease YknZ [Caulifigura coniformis]|uniref:Putative ABC transporter permease YknZ n=1 Tax=Caulifigura coniformis TaxID=2527983 RepID=A0A517SJ31_9PLAN|nr:ABC transporter permease [Caulifigura coniformis]QDT56106.1 putative ABC transporter permease YknZ [Caulifigura coniformis]
MIPLKYNVRNLRVRWITTLMTVIGTGLVVWAMVLTFGLTDGLEHALSISGQPLDLIVLRKGANDETGSNVAQATADQIADLEGVAKNDQGQPLCSAEFVTILTKPRRNNGGTTNLIVRGVDVMSRELRPDFKIVKGRDLKPGVNEAITSENMARRFENLAIGEKLEINKVDFEIVGYFEAGGSSAESEVWTDIRDIASARRTADAISSVNLRARDKESQALLVDKLKNDEQFSLQPLPEPEYFAKQLEQAVFIKFVGLFIAVFLTIGAMFAAANTMFAAVASRGREIGTLRALGFKRRSILLCFLLESVILCLLGGILGCLATLPFNGLSTGTANWATFSEITFAFRFGPRVLLQGVLMSLAMGLLGGLIPAIRAVRLNIVNALREQ